MLTDSDVQTLWVGRAASPNKTTGNDIYLHWKAKLVPLRECEGGGVYTKSRTKIGWAFSYKAAHKNNWSAGFEDSTWHTEDLATLLKRAITDVYTRYCNTTNVCSCKRGYVSHYDDKCGHCRTRKEQKLHEYKLRHGLYD